MNPRAGVAGVALLTKIITRFGLPAILVAAGLLHVQLARRFLSPLFLRDESGYLANAAALAGYTFDGASSYRAGYSLLLAPFYGLFDDPFTIYRLTQATNIGLCLLAIVFLYELLKQLFPSEPREKILLGLLVAASYPAWFAFSTFAFPENAFVPLFVLTCLLCMRAARAGGWAWAAWGACVGFLIMIQPRAFVVAVAGVFVGVIMAGWRRDWRGFAAFIGSVTLFVALDHWLLEPFVLRRLTLGEYPPDLRYPTIAQLFAQLHTIRGLRSLAIHVVAHSAYLLMGTLWLAWFATLYVARMLNECRAQRELRPDALVLVYVVLALLGTIALSALHFTSYPNALRLDHWMYGRYVEGVLMPLLAIGFVAMRRKSFIAGFAIALVLTWTFVQTARIGATNYINVSALWQPFLLPSWSIVGWCAAAGVVALFAILLPDRLRAMAYVAVFVTASVQLYQQNLVYSYQWYAVRHRLASDIRSLYGKDPPNCVGYDQASVEDPVVDSALQTYSNFLFAYRIRRVTFEGWAADCDGPLISWSRDLDRAHPEVPLNLSSFEVRNHVSTTDGPFLWTREPKPWFRMRLGQVLAMSGPEQAEHHILGNGWYETESTGTWSTDSAELRLPLGDECMATAGCELLLRFSTLPISPEQPLSIEAQAENGNATTWAVTSDSSSTEWHTLDLGNLRAPSSGARVNLSIPGAKSPKELGLSADARTLGIMIQELVVRSKDGEQASKTPASR